MADQVIRNYVEGLRDRSLPNGVMERSRLKVVGQDPLPKGAAVNGAVVRLTGSVTLDGWDLGGRGVVVAGKARLVNVLSAKIPGPKAGGPLNPIFIELDGDLEWAEHVEMTGPFAKTQSAASVLNARVAGSGAAYRTGILRMLRRSRFEGFGQDHLKLHGIRGGSEIIEENYFGPQWAPGGKPHADTFTTVSAMGSLTIRRNLVDWTGAGRPIGVNNVFRLVRNVGTDRPVQRVMISENVCHFDPFPSFPMQATAGGKPGWDGPLEVVDNWLSPNGKGRYFHPSTNGAITRWAGNSDIATGRPVPAPAGARTN
ncbi:MAG: hypothetical protein ACKVPY_01580 [Paracoccaceae bacterium]